MAPKQVVYHNQRPEEIMLELDNCRDLRAIHACRLVETGQVYPLNEEELSPVRLALSPAIGEDVSNYPILVGPEDLPFTSLPAPGQLQNILMKDIGSPNFFRFVPSRGSPELDAQATSDLLANMLDPTYDSRGAVIHMESPILNSLRISTPATHTSGTLGTTSIQLTIAPNGEVFDLEYFAYRRIISLLHGTQVVVAFPPLPGNITALRTAYENADTVGSIFTHTSPSLSHGIALVQKASETLLLPPFWSHVIICTQTCASAGYSVASAWGVPDRLRHIDLLRAVMQIWPDTAKEQHELTKYATELAKHMERLLSLNVEGFSKPDKIARPLWKGWDGEFRDKFAGLCAAIGDAEKNGEIREMANMALIKFVEAAHKKRPECRMCHVRVDKMKGTGTSTVEEPLAQHVRVVHGV